MNALARFSFTLYFILIVFLISSCIPSLHPIYTDDTRIIDDRLIGTWTIEPSSDLAALDFDLEITPDGDSTLRFSDIDPDREVSKKMIREAFNMDLDDIFFDKSSIWTIERAANVVFEKNSVGKNPLSISMTLGAPSFAPEGYELTETKGLPFYILTHREVEKGDTTTSYLLVHLTEIADQKYLDFVPFPKGDKRHQGVFAANYIGGHTFAKVDFIDEKLSICNFDSEFIEDLIRKRRTRLVHEKLGVKGDLVLTASTKELRAFISKYGSKSDLFDDSQVFSKKEL